MQYSRIECEKGGCEMLEKRTYAMFLWIFAPILIEIFLHPLWLVGDIFINAFVVSMLTAFITIILIPIYLLQISKFLNRRYGINLWITILGSYLILIASTGIHYWNWLGYAKYSDPISDLIFLIELAIALLIETIGFIIYFVVKR